MVECDIVSKDTKNILKSLKKLRKLNNIYYVWDYNKEFKQLIYSYKYNRKRIIAKLIAELIKDEFYYVLKREKIDVVVSVPVSRKRKNERGYNQVDEILNCLKVNYVQIERVKNTKKMAEILDEEERNRNIEGAFRISRNVDLRNKKILILDDIVTTGATLREIKNSILEQFEDKNGNKDFGINKKSNNIKITVFCLAAAREIKVNRGEI
ncbi:ComF family protein [Leptotrichia trevisanii]|uniref:ComF family protein n=1 Tax=Leptotrichia trevisanii TaxID=109328 RepID=UPI00200B9F44|nr:ComF family protein [Leptotrichia trevisanii]